MGDRNSSRGRRSIPSRSTSGTPIPHDDQTRADLLALIANDNVAVNTLDTAKQFLERNKWIHAGENHARRNLIDILFSVSMIKKLPVDVVNVIRAVALVLENGLEEDITDTFINMLNAKMDVTLKALTSDLTRTKDFLDATTKDQAAAALDIRETAAKYSEISTALAATSEKLTQAATDPPTPPAGRTWAQVAANDAAGPPPNGTQHDPNATQDDIRVQQRMQLNARQIMVEDVALKMNTPQEYKDEINGWLQDYDATDIPEQGKRTAIRGIHIQDRGGLLLELDSDASAVRFKRYAESTDILDRLGAKASISIKPVQVIMRFVPCGGSFDPTDRDHLNVIERDLGLKDGAIMTATWIKKPERRNPSQTVANVKVLCRTPQTGNTLLTERVYVAGSLINTRKDQKEPMRCNQCQEYGHLRDACPNTEKCATCAGAHPSHACDNANHPQCVSCGPDSHHASSARGCPAFKQKCEAFDRRYPENTMPYFPVPGERWTWAKTPPKQQYHPNPRNQNDPGRREPPPPNRQQDGGWPAMNRQTTLDETIRGFQRGAPPHIPVNTTPTDQAQARIPAPQPLPPTPRIRFAPTPPPTTPTNANRNDVQSNNVSNE